MKLLKKLGFVAALLLSANALAHTDEYLDTQASPHGGQVRMTATHHLELVIEGKEIRLYVMNHGNESMPSAGMDAIATVLSGGAKVEVKLTPEEPNLLKGSGEFTASDDMKVVVSIPSTGQQARYTPFQKAEAAGGGMPMQEMQNQGMEGMKMPAGGMHH